jgi:hypothetical protein
MPTFSGTITLPVQFPTGRYHNYVTWVTIEEANAFADNDFYNDPWIRANADKKRRALITATNSMKVLNWDELPEEIPNDLKQACYYIAISLLEGFDPEYEYKNVNLTSQSYGSVKTSYEPNVLARNKIAGIASARAWFIIVKYLKDPNRIKYRATKDQE